MPNIINGSVKNAQLILKSYDLKLGQIKYVPDLAMNAVIKIYKDGDSLSVDGLIEKGSIIDLDVGDGLGNQIFNAPDLIGLDFDEAKFTIIGSGLRVGLINYQDSGFVYNKIIDDLGNEIYEKTKINPGRIFKQFPEKDVRVKIGRKVNLWIVEDSTNEQYQ
jgi:beta-lactam-binding protein with PASTA domain